MMSNLARYSCLRQLDLAAAWILQPLLQSGHRENRSCQCDGGLDEHRFQPFLPRTLDGRSSWGGGAIGAMIRKRGTVVKRVTEERRC